jgi:hypothetical protein
MKDERKFQCPAASFIGLVAAILVCLVNAAPVQAADITGSMRAEVTGVSGSFGFILEGKIEPGDYEKLKSAYVDMRVNQFYLGSPGANNFYLASPGGDLAEAMKIGHLVRALKLHTIVPSRPFFRPAPILRRMWQIIN